MKYFRNPEIKKLILLYLLLTAFFTAAAYHFGCAWLVFAVCLIFAMVSLMATIRRYRRMEKLAASIDELLHGNQRISFAEYQEGEMSVLENELSKMTNRLLEQADQLQQDKKYLSDAMADISHQLRSPLTSSQLILSLLKDMDRQEQLRDSKDYCADNQSGNCMESHVCDKTALEVDSYVNIEHYENVESNDNVDSYENTKSYVNMETYASAEWNHSSSLRRRQLLMELDQLLSHMGWLIESMLKMSKMDAGTAYMKSEPVSVRELLQKSMESILIPMELRGIRYVQTGVTEDASFTGDLAWCSEAILNVVKNCMEHTPEGGCITVSCEDTPLYLKLVVEDDGEGIAPEDLPHIFERFYKGKNAGGQSVGIGLALARMIIAQMNGSIKAENRPEGGARFTIMFYRQETV